MLVIYLPYAQIAIVPIGIELRERVIRKYSREI